MPLNNYKTFGEGSGNGLKITNIEKNKECPSCGQYLTSFVCICSMLPRQHPPTSTPGPADASSGEEICRKFIWGTCDKYEQCRYRHELDIERMKDILQFCHDYQNRNCCTRPNCKFLHATKEEQNHFTATGQIPRVLAERHAAIAAAASNMQTNAETIPQIAMFISESYVSQPPPAPWPPLPPPPAVLPPVATAPPPPPPSSPPRHAAALPPVQLAQQAPPPTVPTTNAQLRPAPTTYPSVPQSPSVLFSMNQPPPLVPPNFDASRPPPPIPSHIQPSNSVPLKRKVDANGNAGSSKTRKPDGPEVSEAHCESCVQRELRIERYKQQMEALHNEEETQILLYKKNLQEYEIGRDILKIIVGPELFVVFNNLIEGAQTPQLEDPSSSFISGSPTVSKQALLQLFQMLLGGGTRNVMEPIPSTSHMDDTLQSLASITRRHNVGSYGNAGPDLIKYVVDTLRNSSAPDRSPSGEERPAEPDMNIVNNRNNGYLANGQKAQASTSEPARYGAAGFSGQSAQSQEFGARAMPTMPNYSVAGPSGYPGPQTPANPPPTGYPVFHPAIPPPPNRPYYAPTPAPGAPNMPYNGTERAPGPVPAQGMQPPGAPAALRPTANVPNYNYMGRYPQPPYFPPYQ